MAGFEPGSSGIGSYCCPNCAKTMPKIFFCLSRELQNRNPKDKNEKCDILLLRADHLKVMNSRYCEGTTTYSYTMSDQVSCMKIVLWQPPRGRFCEWTWADLLEAIWQ